MVDVGPMSKGPSYYLLKCFEKYQYQLADIIGVQSPGNKCYIENSQLPNLKKLEFLPNWMPSISSSAEARDSEYSKLSLQKTILSGRKIFIYAGNLGEAQGIENLAHVMLKLRDRIDCGFLIIGRGSKKQSLDAFIKEQKLQNTLLLDEVDLVTL
jgi:glycosyltransferase involved in cell wall biosynthesis